MSTKVVPLYSDVETTDQVLATFLGPVRGLGQQDQSGACAPYWSPVDPRDDVNNVTLYKSIVCRTMTYLTYSRKGSRRPLREATSDIVVLSPPGMIKASQDQRSASVRTSMNLHFTSSPLTCFSLRLTSCCDACRSKSRCSLKAPCKASTPTVIVVMSAIELMVLTSSQVSIDEQTRHGETAAPRVRHGLATILSNIAKSIELGIRNGVCLISPSPK